jgi:hypothetical protein
MMAPNDIHLRAIRELTAATLEARSELRRGRGVRLILPRWMHEAMTSVTFASVLYDTLSAEFEALDEKLQLIVQPCQHFRIELMEAA